MISHNLFYFSLDWIGIGVEDERYPLSFIDTSPCHANHPMKTSDRVM